jgi:hypothetical protein
MRKTFIVFVSIAIVTAFVSSTSALDRAPKKSGSEGKKEATEIREMTKDEMKRRSRKSTFSEKTARTIQSQNKSETKEAEKAKGWPQTRKRKEKYDYFIDRNNNGIDDRLEKEAKAKKAKKHEPAKKPDTAKKPTPSPSGKSPAKITPVPKPGKKPDAARKSTPSPSGKSPAKISPVPRPAKKVKEEKAGPKMKAPSTKDGKKKQEPRRR